MVQGRSVSIFSCPHLMPSPRVMVKPCVGGGREESFFEHPDAVRIFVCGFFARFSCGFCVRIFVRILDFLACGFHCGFLRGFFLEDFFGTETAGRATQKSSPKTPPQNPPQNPPRILPEYLPVSPPLDSKNHVCTPGCPLPNPTSQCSSFWQLFAVVDTGLAGWC